MAAGVADLDDPDGVKLLMTWRALRAEVQELHRAAKKALDAAVVSVVLGAGLLDVAAAAPAGAPPMTSADAAVAAATATPFAAVHSWLEDNLLGSADDSPASEGEHGNADDGAGDSEDTTKRSSACLLQRLHSEHSRRLCGILDSRLPRSLALTADAVSMTTTAALECAAAATEDASASGSAAVSAVSGRLKRPLRLPTSERLAMAHLSKFLSAARAVLMLRLPEAFAGSHAGGDDDDGGGGLLLHRTAGEEEAVERRAMAEAVAGRHPRVSAAMQRLRCAAADARAALLERNELALKAEQRSAAENAAAAAAARAAAAAVAAGALAEIVADDAALAAAKAAAKAAAAVAAMAAAFAAKVAAAAAARGAALSATLAARAVCALARSAAAAAAAAAARRAEAEAEQWARAMENAAEAEAASRERAAAAAADAQVAAAGGGGNDATWMAAPTPAYAAPSVMPGAGGSGGAPVFGAAATAFNAAAAVVVQHAKAGPGAAAAAALPAGGTAERTNARRWLRSLVSAGVVGGDGSGAADPDFLWTAFASQGLDSATALFALNDCCLCGGSTCSGGADRTGVALAATLRGCGAGGWLGMAPPMGLADFIGNGGDTATAWAVLGLGQVRRGAH